MKLTTTETKKYALLVVKASTGGLSAAERDQFEKLVVKMARPEPRRKARPATAKKPAVPKKPAAAPAQLRKK